MGDRIFTTVKCKCGFEDDDVYYAPTCGFLYWECPECKNKIDLEKHTGVKAESMANTEYGIKAIQELKKQGKD